MHGEMSSISGTQSINQLEDKQVVGMRAAPRHRNNKNNKDEKNYEGQPRHGPPPADNSALRLLTENEREIKTWLLSRIGRRS